MLLAQLELVDFGLQLLHDARQFDVFDTESVEFALRGKEALAGTQLRRFALGVERVD